MRGLCGVEGLGPLALGQRAGEPWAKRVRIVLSPGYDASAALQALNDAGFEAHELDATALRPAGDDTGRRLLARAAVAGFAMMNVMAVSVAVWSGAGDVTREMFHWVSAAIALPALAFSAVPFFASAGALGWPNEYGCADCAGDPGRRQPRFMRLSPPPGAYLVRCGTLVTFSCWWPHLEHRARAAAFHRGGVNGAELPRATRLTATGRRRWTSAP